MYGPTNVKFTAIVYKVKVGTLRDWELSSEY